MQFHINLASSKGDTFSLQAEALFKRSLEIYETNPAEEPDMSKWVTQLAFRLAD